MPHAVGPRSMRPLLPFTHEQRRRSDELRLRMVRWLHMNTKSHAWLAGELGISRMAVDDWLGYGALPACCHARAMEIANMAWVGSELKWLGSTAKAASGHYNG